jgi:S-adenosyl-L-methionine hydrolase (adenosine-forming)
VAPLVSFLSDFGLEDEFVGVCHAVIAGICPEARIIDLGHGIEPQSVTQGARVLAGAMPYVPVGVHLAVVDPGVGSERRAVALATADGRRFVGPDNGLLLPAAEACGGVEAAHAISERRYMLRDVSRTFHGRDVFAPAAAHLAAGVPLDALGPALPPAQLVRPVFPGHTVFGTAVEAAIEHVDRFGNVRLSVMVDDLGDLFEPGRLVEIDTGDDRYYARCAATFADVGAGEFVLFRDSAGAAAVAINRGSAADLIAAGTGHEVRVEFEPRGGDWPLDGDAEE